MACTRNGVGFPRDHRGRLPVHCGAELDRPANAAGRLARRLRRGLATGPRRAVDRRTLVSPGGAARSGLLRRRGRGLSAPHRAGAQLAQSECAGCLACARRRRRRIPVRRRVQRLRRPAPGAACGAAADGSAVGADRPPSHPVLRDARRTWARSESRDRHRLDQPDPAARRRYAAGSRSGVQGRGRVAVGVGCGDGVAVAALEALAGRWPADAVDPLPGLRRGGSGNCGPGRTDSRTAGAGFAVDPHPDRLRVLVADHGHGDTLLARPSRPRAAPGPLVACQLLPIARRRTASSARVGAATVRGRRAACLRDRLGRRLQRVRRPIRAVDDPSARRRPLSRPAHVIRAMPPAR